MAAPSPSRTVVIRRAWRNWALGAAFVAVVFVLQSGYAITNLSVAADLGLTLAQVGLVGAVYTWVFAVAQLGSGAMLDQVGARRCLPVAAAFLTAGALVFAAATGYPMLIAGQVLMALGGAFGFVGAGFIGGTWFPPARYGVMFSLVQFVASGSALLGQRTLSALIARPEFGWQELIAGVAGLGGIVTVLMALFLRDPPGFAGTRWRGLTTFAHGLLRALAQVAGLRTSWVNALIGAATFGALFAMGVVWGPRLLIATGFETAQAYGLASLSWLGLALGAPVISWGAGRAGRLVLAMRLACGGQLVTIGALLYAPPHSTMLTGGLLFAFGFMAGGSMLPYPIAARLVPQALIGTSAAMVNAIQFLASGLLMAGPGSLLETTGQPPAFDDYRLALLLLPAALAGALGLSVVLRDPPP
ncbi:sugar phosphate permease [Rhodovulum imhoffii]|uniref:Sugar phosphate permease n=1 Tax=Rhodovulum imhoffii TaxID=365340 RepID=A0A2T5BSF2_9RHOB|nr:MFS transporter [Rhodovulum imhoffii]MBK5933492.1 hypothetical protein [Rhodovulum imhoffii]PTN02272.1 sugar phosphate permease [Rhodovulum imhoffii]